MPFLHSWPWPRPLSAIEGSGSSSFSHPECPTGQCSLCKTDPCHGQKRTEVSCQEFTSSDSSQPPEPCLRAAVGEKSGCCSAHRRIRILLGSPSQEFSEQVDIFRLGDPQNVQTHFLWQAGSNTQRICTMSCVHSSILGG